jgi:hypothetical protein
MDPDRFLATIIDPGLDILGELGGPAPSDNARREMLAIALQESGPNLAARYQASPSTSPGPARGWWQFEQGGGVHGVLNNSRTQALAQAACERFTIVCADAAVWRALEGHDHLAACFARLLLWSDPSALPTTEQAGWDCYNRNWRPGKPAPDRWPGNWGTATDVVMGC